MKRVVKRRLAKQDLRGHAAFLDQRSPETAIRFLEAAEATCRFLAEFPEIAGLWETDIPKLRGVRVWPVRGFDNHLIFYRPTHQTIEVVRILYAWQNIEAIFQE